MVLLIVAFGVVFGRMDVELLLVMKLFLIFCEVRIAFGLADHSTTSSGYHDSMSRTGGAGISIVASSSSAAAFISKNRD